MSATVRLSPKLPKDDETNGLDAHAEWLLEDPETVRLAVVWLDCVKITETTDDHSRVPTARVRRVEIVTKPEDIQLARAIGTHALSGRTGRAALPLGDDVAGDLFADE